MPRGTALEVLLAGAAGAAIGTRLFHLVVSGDILRLPVSAWADTSQGTASWGAYLGGIAGVTAYAALSRGSPLPHLDVATSCAGLGDVIGRWACYLAGDDFGTVTSVPWAIQFPSGSLAHQAHVSRGLLDIGAPAPLPVHPITAAAFLLLYGSTRFWWEFFRDPGGRGAMVFPSTSQWICMLLVLAGAMSLRLLRSSKGTRAEAVEA